MDEQEPLQRIRTSNRITTNRKLKPMEREIKFRGWDSFYKRMDYDPRISDGTDGGETAYVRMNSAIDCHAGILMQYTGREDAQVDGNPVYEGDIIENCDTKALQVVYWNEHKAAWYCKYNNEDRTVSLEESLGNLNKVIGNIYEHAELLK